MKIKLDENLPLALVPLLKALGHDAQTTQEEGLQGCPDEQVWDAAQEESRFLVTQDLDFSDSRRFAPGSHCGVLIVRLHTPSRENLTERIANLFRTEAAEDWSGCFVVATERKVRVRRPPSR
jgi:predicted nuclease of predicted toxin-antitoxin system